MGKIEKVTYGILVIAILIVAYNAFQISQLKNFEKNAFLETKRFFPNQATADIEVIPKGTPEIYGKELDVSYNDISAVTPQKSDSAIKKLGMLDEKITLGGKDLERYISVVSQISCEYCCGVDSIIFKDGKPACTCAHSFAMRGLAKYLIKNHGNEYTNDEILEELGKWKTLFFPTQITQKAQILQQKGIQLSYINLASNKYRTIAVNAVEKSNIDTSGWTEDEKMMY